MGVCDSSKSKVKEVLTAPNNSSNKLDQFMVNVSKSLCKIEYENQTATGFLIKLFKEGKEFFCMMTCGHFITREIIEQRKSIRFYYDVNDAKAIGIELEPNKRFIQNFTRLSDMDNNIDINIDATVIEILPEDKIPKEFFLSFNENYIDNNEPLKDKEITIISNSEGKLEYFYGKIKEIDRYKIIYTSNIKNGSAGSPIFLRNTIKVIGIHTGEDKRKAENYGYCIGPIFSFFRNFYDNKKIMNNNMYNKSAINYIKYKENLNDIPINKPANHKLNKMILLYRIEEDPVRIFGDDFVKKNKNNCYLLIDGKERELCETLTLNEFNEINGLLEIILIEKNIITDMSYMFSDGVLNPQISLIIVSDKSEWDTTNVTNMSYMFYKCISLKYLPAISKWNTTNVSNMSGMFCGCQSLKSLPEISEWNTTNVTDMSHMFSDCQLLKSLPDISNWNTTNVKDMSYMFLGCQLFKSLPDLHKWNIKNVTNMSHMFGNCSSLVSLPDISQWNTTNVKDMSSMFGMCFSLKFLPDISKWITTNVTNMNVMFYNCSSLISLPDISNWNTTNVKEMNQMFWNCSSLIYLPDISKWNVTNVTSMNRMFSECISLKSLPDISKWKLNKELDKGKMFLGCNELIIPEKFKE